MVGVDLRGVLSVAAVVPGVAGVVMVPGLVGAEVVIVTTSITTRHCECSYRRIYGAGRGHCCNCHFYIT
jgi:hypothetical protein